MELEDILSDIANQYKGARNSSEMKLANVALDYESLAPNLFIKMINYDKNLQLLSNAVHEKYMDMALTVRYLVNADENGLATAQVTYKDLERWGKSKDEIMELAKKNTRELFPPVCTRLDAVLMGMFPDEADMISEMSGLDDMNLYVLTNNRGINGAVAMMYDDFINKLSEKYGNKDIYILPSSIHEVLLLPADNRLSVDELQAMVMNVNRTNVAEQDFLSDSVYKFDAREKTISLVSDTRDNYLDDYYER